MKTLLDLCNEAGLPLTDAQRRALDGKPTVIKHGVGEIRSFSGEVVGYCEYVETFRSPRFSTRYEGAIVMWSHISPSGVTMVHHYTPDGTIDSGVMCS